MVKQSNQILGNKKIKLAMVLVGIILVAGLIMTWLIQQKIVPVPPEKKPLPELFPVTNPCEYVFTVVLPSPSPSPTPLPSPSPSPLPSPSPSPSPLPSPLPSPSPSPTPVPSPSPSPLPSPSPSPTPVPSPSPSPLPSPSPSPTPVPSPSPMAGYRLLAKPIGYLSRIMDINLATSSQKLSLNLDIDLEVKSDDSSDQVKLKIKQNGTMVEEKTVAVDNQGKKDGIAFDLLSTPVNAVFASLFLAGDLNENSYNLVNSLDYAIFVNRYRSSDKVADFNGDGQINSLDYSIFVRNYNKAGEE